MYFKYVLGTYWYVLCICVRYMYAVVLQHEISAPIQVLVFNIRDIILVRTRYVLVCTVLYHYTFPVPIHTGTYRERTST